MSQRGAERGREKKRRVFFSARAKKVQKDHHRDKGGGRKTKELQIVPTTTQYTALYDLQYSAEPWSAATLPPPKKTFFPSSGLVCGRTFFPFPSSPPPNCCGNFPSPIPRKLVCFGSSPWKTLLSPPLFPRQLVRSEDEIPLFSQRHQFSKKKSAPGLVYFLHGLELGREGKQPCGRQPQIIQIRGRGEKERQRLLFCRKRRRQALICTRECGSNFILPSRPESRPQTQRRAAGGKRGDRGWSQNWVRMSRKEAAALYKVLQQYQS